MRTTRRLGNLTTTLGTAAISIAILATSPALAAPSGSVTAAGTPSRATWTVKPGGNASGKATNLSIEDPSTTTTITCTTSTVTTTTVSGSGQSGTHIVSTTTVTTTTCVIKTSGIAVKVTTSASPSNPWFMNALTYNSTAGVTTGKITGVKATASGTGCSLQVAGTSATSPGTLKVTYTNSTGVLKILTTGGNLHAWNVTGCTGLISNGDPITIKASYKVTPKQVITSP